MWRLLNCLVSQNRLKWSKMVRYARYPDIKWAWSIVVCVRKDRCGCTSENVPTDRAVYHEPVEMPEQEDGETPGQPWPDPP